ncbi:conserved hypothetical protein [Flavobacterium sp. 9AF]|nr:conserved hypothetical protein [Flavobacterium sp. 9AF]
MKIILIFFIAFFSNEIYCQSLESIKKADTIYIYFDHSEFQNLKGPDINSIKILEEKRNYEIKFDNSNYVNFKEAKYLDFDRVEEKKVSDIKIKKKNFLRKNKHIIIDINFIKKYGLKMVFFLIYYKKIYLIDKKEITKNNVILKEVALHRYSYSFEE